MSATPPPSGGPSRRYHGRKLFLKFTLIMFLVIAMTLLGLSTVVLLHQEQLIEKETWTRWEEITEVSCEGLENAIGQLDLDFVVRAVRPFAEMDDVESCSVIDHKFRWIAESDREEWSDEVEFDPLVARCVKTGLRQYARTPRDSDGPKQHTIATPLHLGDEVWAVARFRFSNRRLDDLRRELYLRLGGLVLVFLLGGVVGSLFLARHIARPVGTLAGVADRVAAGDLDVRCAMKRADELGLLARSFEDMIGRLKVARDDARIYLDNILESMIDALVVVDLPGKEANDRVPRIRTVNQAALDLLGYGEGSLAGEAFDRIIGGPTARKRLLDRLLSETALRNEEATCYRRDGTSVSVRFSASLMTTRANGKDAREEIEGFILLASDISELRRAERIRSATQRLSESIQAGGSLDDLFASVHRILGGLMPVENFYIALRDTVTGRLQLPYFVDSRDGKPARADSSRSLTAYALECEGSLRLTEAGIRNLVDRKRVELIGSMPVSWLGTPLTVSGRRIGLIGVQSYDPRIRYGEKDEELLTYFSDQIAMAIERRRAEVEQARLTSAVEQAADAIFITDPDGVIEYVNPAFTEITGYAPREAVGHTPRLLKSHQHDEEFYRELWATVTSGRPWTGRLENRRKDGDIYEADATISPVKDDAGRIVNFVCVQHDITNEVALEQQLRQSQKMEAIGQLAGGIAHDFNNLLSVITGYSELVLRGLARTDRNHGKLEEIHKAGRRASSLTRQLLAFSRRQVLKAQVINLNNVVEDMDRMLRRLIGENIELRVHLEPDLARVQADLGQLEQVVMNLVVNARDAMMDGGRLTIETSNVQVTEGVRHGDVAPGDYVRLSVTDNGTGMDSTVLARIFDPFFTTKPPGRGTGLGLSTVYGIVRQSNGHISASSVPGEGTVFEIFLPQVVTVADREETGPSSAPALTGSGTVLLVEDEAGVRELASEILEISGYEVIRARNGKEALVAVEECETKIDLLLTDMVMPKMGGADLATHLRERQPDLSVVFMSGYTESTQFQAADRLPGAAFLEKPFLPDDLARVVHDLLASRVAPSASLASATETGK